MQKSDQNLGSRKTKRKNGEKREKQMEAQGRELGIMHKSTRKELRK